LRALFNAADEHKHGHITFEEVSAALHITREADKARLLARFHEADVNKDGKLHFEEFENFATHESVQQTDKPSLFVGLTKQLPYIPKPKDSLGTPPPLPPTIIVPGIAGSALSFNDHRSWQPELSIYVVDLFVTWHAGTATATSNLPVTVVPGLDGVSYLGVNDTAAEFAPLISYFVDNFSNTANALQAAPYDWRLVPDKTYSTTWQNGFKAQIENLYKANQNQKVNLIGHSLGNLQILYFLNTFVNSDWKSTYVASYIGVSPPYGGAPVAVKAEISGIEIGTIPLSNRLFGPFPSVPWLFPNPVVFPSTLITVDSRQYSASADDIEKVLSLADFGTPASIFKQLILDIGFGFLSTHPGVSTHIVTSTFVPTPIAFHYAKSLLDDPTAEVEPLGPNIGDGVVPYASAHANDVWLSKFPSLTAEKVIPGFNHATILSAPDFFNHLGSLFSPHH